MKWASLGFPFFFLKRSFFFDRWVGHRLLPKKTVPVYRHAGKSLSLGSYGSDQGKLHFLRTCFVALLGCRGGLARFLSCGFGCSVDSVSHLGPWNLVLDLLGYPPGSSTASANGALLQPLPLHPGFAPGCGLWSGVGSCQQALHFWWWDSGTSPSPWWSE